MNTSFFGELLQTISERGRALLARDRRGDASARSENLVELCEHLLSGRGEASGVALAREILNLYGTLTIGPRIAFFEALAQRFGIDTARMDQAVDTWRASPSDATSKPVRFGLRAAPAGTFPQADLAPAGTAALVRMREQLMDALDHRRDDFAAVDADLFIFSRPGSIADFWCCGTSTGRHPQSSSKKLSATKPCTRFAAGMICDDVSTRRIAVAMPSFIQR